MTLADQIRALMAGSSRALSPRLVASMLPTQAGVDTVGTLMRQMALRGVLTTVSVAGKAYYLPVVVRADSPWPSAPAPIVPARQLSPLMVDVVHSSAVMASTAHNAALEHRAPPRLASLLATASKALDEAHRLLTGTPATGGAP